jgi:hypothetical protein
MFGKDVGNDPAFLNQLNRTKSTGSVYVAGK